MIQSHPTIGAEILDNISEMPDISIGTHWHYERYDGKGYPDRLKGEEIPETARIKGWYRAENSALYYYDWGNGQMIYGEYQIDGKPCYFDPITGIAADCIWTTINGNDYWYENGIRQGLEGCGKEIYDPASDAWY